jgi:hypothetical protein
MENKQEGFVQAENGSALDIIPNKLWFTLRESCDLKGISYFSACNKKELQPKGGVPDAVISGRNVWRRDTIAEWLYSTDKACGKPKEIQNGD